MDAREATLALLAARAEDATVCPSEVARAVTAAAGDWREAMPEVHAAVDQMVGDGLVRLSWKGRWLVVRAGPYRIGRGGVKAQDAPSRMVACRNPATAP